MPAEGRIQSLLAAMASRKGAWKFRPDLYCRALGTWDSPIIELPAPVLIAVLSSPDPEIAKSWERLTAHLPKPAVDHSGASTTKNFSTILMRHEDVSGGPAKVHERSLPVPKSQPIALTKGKKMIVIRFRFKGKEQTREVEMPIVPRVGDFVQGTTPGSEPYRVESVVFGIERGSKSCTEITVNLSK